jgi:serine/threonine protein kinase
MCDEDKQGYVGAIVTAGPTSRSGSESAMSDNSRCNEDKTVVLACPHAWQKQREVQQKGTTHGIHSSIRTEKRQEEQEERLCSHMPLVKKRAATSSMVAVSPKIKWPYILYISMEAVPGVTLDVWMKHKVQSGLLPQPSNNNASRNWSSNVTTGSSDDALSDGNEHKGARNGSVPGQLGGLEREIFRQLVTGLLHCHAAGVIHRGEAVSSNQVLRRKSSGYEANL